MINNKQFRSLIVQPTLQKMELWSQKAEDLIVMTMAHESNGGYYLDQESGPAIGIFQMEEATFNDIWRRYLLARPELENKIMTSCNLHHIPDAGEMAGNLYLATAMARVFYYRVYTKIPDDLHEMSKYCKKYWNTDQGKATADQYYGAYLKFIS